MISDTGEIRFSPDESCFSFIGENCAFFAGKPSEVLMKSNTKIQEIKASECRLTEQFSFAVKNDRIAISLLTLDGKFERIRTFINFCDWSFWDGWSCL